MLDSSSCCFSDPGSKGQVRFKLVWRFADGRKRCGSSPGVSGAALAGIAGLSRAAARFEELDERKVGTERLGNKTSIDPPGGRCRVLGKGKRRKYFLEARGLVELPAACRATISWSWKAGDKALTFVFNKWWSTRTEFSSLLLESSSWCFSDPGSKCQARFKLV